MVQSMEQPKEQSTEQAAGAQPEQSLARTLGRPALEDLRADRQVERLPGAHLKLKLGNKIFIKLACVDKRYEAKIVGSEPFAYIIVQLRLPQDTLAKLQQNPNAIAQINAGGALFGFRTEVLNRVSQPAPLLIFSYPETVERVVLRRNERLKISVPGKIHGTFGEHEVLLTDIAPEGCSFVARADLKSPLRSAQLGDRMVLHCELNGACQLPMVTPVLLRRLDESKGRISMGGQFVEVSESTAATLNEYLKRIHLLVGE